MIAGFVATVAMTIAILPAYFVSLSLGSSSPGAGLAERWLWGLANNVLTQKAANIVPALALHLSFGMAFAFIYATLAEPRLRGPGWLRGVIFAMGPWILSVTLFFPLVGAGMFGGDLAAGPLPLIGNFVVHVIYGAVLGKVYSPYGQRYQTETGSPGSAEEVRILNALTRSVAWGIVAGLVSGGAAGALGGMMVGGQVAMLTVAGAAAGSIVGATIASFSAVPDSPVPARGPRVSRNGAT